MITLTQLPPIFGLRISGSPFCAKVEVMLRASGLPFRVVSEADPRKAPKGKLPVVEDGGEFIADSNFILEHLKQRHAVDFDESLSGRESAVARAFMQMCEEHLYWGMLLARWGVSKNWQQLRQVAFEEVPVLVRTPVAALVRRKILRDAAGHGMGRHSVDEINTICATDIAALSAQLGDREFFMGEQHSSADLTVYAFMACLIEAELDTELKAIALGHKNLVAYVERLGTFYWKADA